MKAHAFVLLFVVAGLVVLIGYASAQEPAPDVLKLRDGTALVGRFITFEGSELVFDIGGQQVRFPRAQVRRVELGQVDRDAKVLFVVSSEDAPADEELKRALERVGLDVTIATKVEAPIDQYQALVIHNTVTTTPELADVLREYIANGGGCVLTGYVPWSLAGENAEEAKDRDRRIDTSAFSDWLGAGTFSNFSEPVHRLYWSRYVNPFIESAVSAPFGVLTAWQVGDQLWSLKGTHRIPACPQEALSGHAIPVCYARGVGDSDEVELLPGVCAFAHSFGKGRVYYQAIPSAPDFPKLQELFTAGVRWAAGVLPVVVP